MSYAKYPKEMKEAVIARMLQGDETVTDIQRDTGIGINTLYRWRDKALNQNGLSATTKYKNADKWSSQDKFTVVIETANLSEIEFSEYCREKGIYPEQVKEWKETCINANDNAREKNTKASKELREERKEKEKLEKISKELTKEFKPVLLNYSEAISKDLFECQAKVDDEGKIIYKIHLDYDGKFENYEEFLRFFHTQE